MNSKFEIVACTPSNEGKTFVWKLAIKTSAAIFGITKTVTRTYYIGGMPSAVKIGTVMEEDLTKFDIVERPFVIEEEGKEPETIKLKWLHVKVLAA